MDRKIIFTLFLSAILFLSAGCSGISKKYRRTLNLLDENVRIESTAGRIAAAPVFAPVGTLAFMTDAAIVHPICALPEAVGDTWELLWEDSGDELDYIILFLPKVVITPVIFTGDWIARILFPI